MSTKDPHDGLTDDEIDCLNEHDHILDVPILTNWIRRLASENAALKADVARWRQAVLDYGDHSYKCRFLPPTSFDAANGGHIAGRPCDCGLDQLFNGDQ